MQTAPKLGNAITVTEWLTGFEDMQTLEALFDEITEDLKSQKKFGPLRDGNHRWGTYPEEKNKDNIAFEKKWGINLRRASFSDPMIQNGWDIRTPIYRIDQYNLNAHNARKMLLVNAVLPALLKGMIIDLKANGDVVNVESKVNEWKVKAKTLLEEQIYAKDPRKKAEEGVEGYQRNNEYYAYFESRPGWQSKKAFSAERYKIDNQRLAIMHADHAALEQEVNQMFESAIAVPNFTDSTHAALSEVTKYIN